MRGEVRELLAVGLIMAAGAAAPAWVGGPTEEQVSAGPGGAPGNGEGGLDGIAITSADGRFLAFTSSASSLVPGDTNGVYDVFVHDRWRGTIERVSVGPGSVQGNGESGAATISADGRFVAFDSSASNLVPGDTNEEDDVFVRDRWRGTTERVGDGGDGPGLSGSGRFVVFAAGGERFVHDRQTGWTERAAEDGTEQERNRPAPVLSADSRSVAFQADNPSGVPDRAPGQGVFVYDR
jgi:Tol biopolymer transport system component